jgi:NADPH:quinone reductase-like Zn-dependent oxidoreductase
MIGLIVLSVVLGILIAVWRTYQTITNFITLRKNKLSFAGKTIWITGASSGIGEALAIRFSQLGANLVLSARNSDALAAVKRKCNTRVDIVPFDLSDPLKALDIVEKYLSSLNGRSFNLIYRPADQHPHP